ncbi:hypothetical protein M0R45_016047 [Rubus argutus]|uniref:Uncharacterized protein n=1 Tax=Rubus argutus TaxID=59490 RepID=A0AAW1XRH4_RUBAR
MFHHTINILFSYGVDLADFNSRISSIPNVKKESVVGGDYIKIRKLSDQIVLTTAGNTELCDKIILNAKNLIKLTRGSDSMKFLRLKEQLRKFRRKWKKDHLGQIFPGEFMLCGKYEGKRTIFVIRHHATEKFKDFYTGGRVRTGALGMGGFVRDRKVPHVLDKSFTHYDEVHYKAKRHTVLHDRKLEVQCGMCGTCRSICKELIRQSSCGM